jgi:hypothetical protein
VFHNGDPLIHLTEKVMSAALKKLHLLSELAQMKLGHNARSYAPLIDR